MRLKIQLSSQKSTNSEILAGVDWLNEDEAISVDDHRILRWSCSAAAEGKLEATSLPNYATNNNEPIFPTSIQLVRRSTATADSARSQNSTKISIQKPRSTVNSPNNAYSNNELILMTASDGKIHLINLSGKLEKSIEAHKGAAILARWSNAEPGGAGGFASCGEDGCVKIWSRNGMLRSVLCKIAKPIYALDWNGDSSKLAYCAGEDCFIKSMNTQTSPTKWHAHSGLFDHLLFRFIPFYFFGLVLCLSWSAINDQIVTGGEDCRYRLWDGQGRPLWSSVAHGFPITSIAWSPNGEMFAVGAYNLLRLCDKSGWSHSMERSNSGSIYCLSWSTDSTQLVGGCANGQLLHAQTFEKRLMWEHFEAVQNRNKTINIRDFSSDVAREMLEIRDRIIRLELGFNFLVVATIKQCYIFSAKNWNTPIVTNLKESNGAITLIRLCEKCFLLVDSISVQVWNYEGRILSTIRLPQSSSTFGEPFNEQTAAISNDLVVLRDRAQHSLIHLFDPQNGRTTGDGQITHNAKIVELCVNQCGPISDRRVAFVDSNGDCFLALVNCFGAAQRSIKIGSLISCLSPSNCTNMLAAFQDNHRLIVWTWPTVAFVDRDLLQPTQLELANSAGGELGKSSVIIGFIGNTITVRRSDGCLVAHYVPPFIAGLLRCAQQSHWDQAIRICRSIKEEFLWATLAGMAVAEKQFSIAEICYGQLHEAEKVLFLSSLRGQQNAQIRSAQIAQFGGQIRECESALIKEGRYFRAIMLNVGAFRFEKALELAIKSGTHLDTVLGYRQRYLELLGRKENDPKFLKHLSQVEIDWPHIFAKIHEDEQKDQQHHQWGNAGGGGLSIPN